MRNMVFAEKYAHLIERRWYVQSFNATPILLHLAGMSGTFSLKKHLGYGYRALIKDYKNDFCEMYYDKDDFHSIAHEFEERLLQDKNYLEDLVQKSEERKETAHDVMKKNHGKLGLQSDKNLLQLYQNFNSLFYEMIAESHMIEGYALTRDVKLKSLLLLELQQSKKQKSFTHYFMKLTKPIRKPFIVDYNNALVKISLEIKKSPDLLKKFQDSTEKELIKTIQNYPNLLKLFSILEEKFFWVNVSYVSAYRLEKIDFIKDVKRVLEEKENNIIEENIFQKNFLDKERIISELKLSNEAVKIIETTDIMAYWQDDRKKYILQGLCFIEECIGDFSKRFGISAHLLHYLLPEEITLQKLKTLKKSFLEERVRGCFIIYENGKFNVFSGADYENFKNAMQRQQENVSVGEITGMCASIGKALGKVRICKTLDDIKSFEEGQILVTGMTRPEFVPAMKKASAIVTDEGGITSHAAVIAREFKKPCVIGTKIATKSLKNGDLVEVNANHGIVKKLK